MGVTFGVPRLSTEVTFGRGDLGICLIVANKQQRHSSSSSSSSSSSTTTTTTTNDNDIDNNDNNNDNNHIHSIIIMIIITMINIILIIQTKKTCGRVPKVIALSLAQVPMGWRFARARHWIRIPYQGLAAGEQKEDLMRIVFRGLSIYMCMYIYIYIYIYM